MGTNGRRGRNPKRCPDCRREHLREVDRARRPAVLFRRSAAALKVFERDGWICQLCREAIDPATPAGTPGAPELDHVIPTAAGGSHDPSNLQAAHRSCNQRKGQRFPVEVAA